MSRLLSTPRMRGAGFVLLAASQFGCVSPRNGPPPDSSVSASGMDANVGSDSRDDSSVQPAEDAPATSPADSAGPPSGCAPGTARCAGSGREVCVGGKFQTQDCSNAPPGGLARCINDGECDFTCPGLNKCNGACRACCNSGSDCEPRGTALSFCDGDGKCAYRCGDGRELCGNTCCGTPAFCLGSSCEVDCRRGAMCDGQCTPRFSCVAIVPKPDECVMTTSCNLNRDGMHPGPASGGNGICDRSGLARELTDRFECPDETLKRLGALACQRTADGSVAGAVVAYNLDSYDASTGSLVESVRLASATCSDPTPIRQ
jgi:hypothetical protein